MTADKAFLDYFRCPIDFARFGTQGDLSASEGYFTFESHVCYGRRSGGQPSRYVTDGLLDVSHAVRYDKNRPGLPFDFSDVVRNLRLEQYRRNGHSYLGEFTSGRAAQGAYYFLRPMMPVGVRKHLQKIRLRGWENIPFPRWPVDLTVDGLMQSAMALLLRNGAVERIPFVWFWPDGAEGCAIVTHDVEGPAGRDFCGRLMDLDDAYGVKSAFQIVPEGQESSWRRLADRLRSRGFEVNVHDLNHDGYLFRNREQFLRRAAEINRYVREFECRGFRAGAMYREQKWYDAFEFSYDMSVPNVAHLEPQRGGCCTVMPYFAGHVLELPLTTAQDYSLFHILGEYSTALWRQQVELILSKHGLISFIVHPDYLLERRARAVYEELLAYLASLREARDVWVALPGEVDRWWRNRSRLSIVREGGTWRIDGPDSHRARLAFATLQDGRVIYETGVQRVAPALAEC